ncbi:MAG: hypothetical protein JXQ30_07910 [Spirochaetes bacterium]|nr:hypothetical protein [Spirochaetota bacterium]
MKSSPHKLDEGGFFSRLFTKGSAQQKRTLRVLKRELNASRIELYKIKNDTISPAVAKLLYEIYRLSYPMRQQLPLDGSGKRFLPSFEEAFILTFHTKEASSIHEKLGFDTIRKLAETHGMPKTVPYVEKMLDEYSDQWDRETISKINTAYANLIGFARFVYFDFFPLLREFDLKLDEGDFQSKTSFSPAEGTLLLEDLVGLHRALFRFDADTGLDIAMEALARIAGTDPGGGSYPKLRKAIATLQRNNYIETIIRAIKKSLSPVPVEKRRSIDIFQHYIQRRRSEVGRVLRSLESKLRDEAVGTIVSRLFDGSVDGRVNNYGKSHNETYQRFELPPYRWVEPLNYLKAFLTDKYVPSISEIINELIVGGIFINKHTLTELSNCYYALKESLSLIETFDSDLDMDGDKGRLMKRLLDSVTKEQSARRALINNIEEVNEKAKSIIDGRIVSFRELAVSIKKIVEDYKQKSPSVVSNIRKIRAGKNRQFIEDMAAAYKDIYWFLKLLSHYLPLQAARDESSAGKTT